MHVSEPKHLLDLFSELFLLAPAFKGAALNNADPQLFRSNLLTMFGTVEQQCEANGLPSEVVAQAKFALAVFIDEMIMTSKWRDKNQWAAQLLQYELFKTQAGGVE